MERSVSVNATSATGEPPDESAALKAYLRAFTFSPFQGIIVQRGSTHS